MATASEDCMGADDNTTAVPEGRLLGTNEEDKMEDPLYEEGELNEKMNKLAQPSSSTCAGALHKKASKTRNLGNYQTVPLPLTLISWMNRSAAPQKGYSGVEGARKLLNDMVTSLPVSMMLKSFKRLLLLMAGRSNGNGARKSCSVQLYCYSELHSRRAAERNPLCRPSSRHPEIHSRCSMAHKGTADLTKTSPSGKMLATV